MVYVNPKDAQITLLTQEQAEKLPQDMLSRDCWYWLRSSSISSIFSDYMACIDAFGTCYNDCINNNYGGVVPAFIVGSLDAKLGDKVYVGKLKCTVIDDNLVFSDKAVCQHRYDAKSNDWETSELKAFIESREFTELYVTDSAEYELNRKWLSDGNGEIVAEAKFIVSGDFLNAVLQESFLSDYSDLSDFLACYIPDVDGQYIYRRAKEQDALIKDLGIVYYGGYAADEARITLLTKEQAEKLPQDMLKRGCWWWLRSPNFSNYVSGVDYVGWAYGSYVNSTYGGVVPAFRIDNLNAKFGDKIQVGRLQCTVVSDNLVLSDKVVCQHRFDAESSDWETSELKVYIESEWFADCYVKGIVGRDKLPD